MNCPACGTAMTEVAVSDVKIQACKGGCGGLWFDEWTLRKVDQPDQSAGEALLHIEQNAAVKLDPEKRRNCPRDAGIAWAIASLLRVQLDRGVLLDVQQRFPRRLVRLVDLPERPFVEPQPAAATLASLDLDVAHRDLRHRRAAGWTVHRDDSFARVFKVSDNPNGSSTRCATSRPSRTGITDAIHCGSA